jgi:hypothetical protein
MMGGGGGAVYVLLSFKRRVRAVHGHIARLKTPVGALFGCVER